MTTCWRRIFSLVLGVCLVAGLAPGAGSRETWGPFRAQVVDVETGQPIAGAVVLVVWLELYGIFGNHRFAEAREAVTDAEGRFEIPRLTGLGWKLGIQPPSIHVFAPGYIPYGRRVTPVSGEVFVDPTVFLMRRLKTREELLNKNRSRPVMVPFEKMREFTKAVNVEREMLGFSPLPIVPSEEKQP